MTRIATTLIRLVRNILLARLLGPLERGALSAVVAMIEILVAICGFGLPIAAAKEAANTPNRSGASKPAATLTLLFATFAAIAAYFILKDGRLFKDFHDLIVPFSLLVAVTCGLFLVRHVAHSVLAGSERISASNLVRLGESALLLILFLVFLTFAASRFDAAINSWFAAYFAIAAAAIVLIFRHGGRGASSLKIKNLTALVKTGLRSYPDDIAQMIIFRSDVLFISAFAGGEAAAFYTIALVASEMLLILSEAGTTAATRRLLIEPQEGGKDPAQTFMFARFTLYLVTPAAIILSLTASFWIVLVFGEPFLPAAAAVPWLAPGVIALSAAGYARLGLIGKGNAGLVSVTNVACAIINLTLNIILIPRYGIIGAAAASSITYISMAMVHLLHYSYRTSRSPLFYIWHGAADIIVIKKALKGMNDFLNRSINKKRSGD